MASIVIDGVTQPGNAGEGEYPKFIVNNRTGFFTIQLTAPTGTPDTYSGGQQQRAAIQGDDASIYQWLSIPQSYTQPANLPPIT